MVENTVHRLSVLNPSFSYSHCYKFVTQDLSKALLWLHFTRKDVLRFIGVDASYRCDQLKDRTIIGLKVVGDIAKLADAIFQQGLIVVGKTLAVPLQGFGFFTGFLDGYNGSIQCYRSYQIKELLCDSSQKNESTNDPLTRTLSRQKMEQISWLFSSISFGGYSAISLARLVLPTVCLISAVPFLLVMGASIAAGMSFSMGESKNIHAQRYELFFERFKRDRFS